MIASLVKWFYDLADHGQRVTCVALRPDLWCQFLAELREFGDPPDGFASAHAYIQAPWGRVRIERRAA